MTRQADYDVIVIGAGIGGLTCGALLAQAGFSTLIVEKHDRPGGYVTSYERVRHGRRFTFDVPHVIGGLRPGQPVARILSRLGVSGPEFIEIEPYQRFIYPDLDLRAFTDVERYQAELTAAFPQQAAGIARYYRTLADLWSELNVLPLQLWRKAADSLAESFPLIARYADRTFQHLLDEHLDDPRLKTVLATPWPYLGLPASHISAVYMATMLMSFHTGGAWYPQGGYQRLSDALAEGLRRHGGELLLRTLVSGIVLDGRGRAVAVELADGRQISGRHIISNADTPLTFLRLVGEERLPSGLAEQIRRARMSFSGLVVHLGVEMDLAGLDLDYGSVFFLPSYGASEELYHMAQKGQVPDPGRVGVGLSVPSLRDPSLCPPGTHVMDILLTPLPWDYRAGWRTEWGRRRTRAYRRLKKRLAGQMIKVAETLIPGLGDHIVVQEVAAPPTYEAYTLSSGGAWYDLAPTPAQGGLNRMGPQTPIPNLYLTGAKSFPGGGMYGSMMGGVFTADSIGEGILLETMVD